MFANVIWATDGSEHADRALGYALNIARGEHATLHAVHIAEVLAGRMGGQYSRVNEPETKSKVRDQCDAAAQEGIDVKLHMMPAPAGEAASRLAGVASDVDADLIVVGTRGHGALAGALIGSVTQRLLHVAPCPVLAVPPARRRTEVAAPSAATSAGGVG